MQREISIHGGESVDIKLSRGEERSWLQLGSRVFEVTHSRNGDEWSISIEGLTTRVVTVVDKDDVLIHAFGRTWRASLTDPAERALMAAGLSDVAKAPMPGVAISVLVKCGDSVEANQILLIIESMKMQMEIRSSRAGTVDAVHARVGETFQQNASLVTLLPLDTVPA
jgi:biotin carboxyl carrier protein